MGLMTGSMRSGLKEPEEVGKEEARAVRAMGEEILMELWRLNFWRDE